MKRSQVPCPVGTGPVLLICLFSTHDFICFFFLPRQQGSRRAGPNLVLVSIHDCINKGSKSASEPETKLLAPDFYFCVMITG